MKFGTRRGWVLVLGAKGVIDVFTFDDGDGPLMTNRALDDLGTLSARAARPGGRRPAAVDDLRICLEEECDTRLNRYNCSERCYRHQKRRFPRVRGRPLR